MNATQNRLRLSDIEFARLGGGHLAYIREIDAEKASVLLGETPAGATGPLFCLYGADGNAHCNFHQQTGCHGKCYCQ